MLWRSRRPSQQKISMAAWITLVILGLIQIITSYGETMLVPAIPDIIMEFNISYNTSSWILSAYLIAGAVTIPIAAKISDFYSRKKMIIIIMMIYILGIVIGGLSSSITFLIVARVIQGIGISMFPIAFGIIKDQFPKEKLAIAVGIFTSMSAVGSVVGLVLGAGIIENFGWRGTFFSVLPIATGLWIVIMHYIRESPRATEDIVRTTKQIPINHSGNKLMRGIRDATIRYSSIDIKGTIALATAITSFLLVLLYPGENTVLGSPQNVGFLTIGSISLVLFVNIERRSESPLITLQLLTNKVIFRLISF
jgi:MFS family permease